MTQTSFQVNERVTNDRGAWATLRYDSLADVWTAQVYAADFPADVASDRIGASRRRAGAERAARQWLAAR